MRQKVWIFSAIALSLFLLFLVPVFSFGAEEEITSSQPPAWVQMVKDWQLTSISLQPDPAGMGGSFAHLLYRQDREQKERNSAILTYELVVDIGSPMAKVGKLAMALWLDAGGNQHRWVNAELEKVPPTEVTTEPALRKF